MACTTRPALLLSLALLAACGPEKSTSDADTGTSGGATGSSGGGSTEAPTTGADASTSTTGSTTNATTVEDSDSFATLVTTLTEPPTTTDGDTDPDEVCPEDITVGSPCNSDGLFCGPSCADPCQFCNVVKCEHGQWHPIEVFPNDCLDCDMVCDFVVAAECNAGPPDKPTCVAGCLEDQNGVCMLEFNQMLGCIGAMPTFACDALTRPVVAGCEAQFEKLYQCTGR